MSRRKQVETKQIQAPYWDTHEIVIVKSLTGFDNDWIQDRSTVMTAGETNMRILAGTTQRLTLLRGIESWTLTDANNQPLPWPPLSMREAENAAAYQIREKSLDHVFTEDRSYIFGEINALGQPMTEEEKKGSSTSVTTGSQDGHNASQNQLSIIS
jgi:hypothetical protein